MLRSPGCEMCAKYRMGDITCEVYPNGIPNDIVFKIPAELKKICPKFTVAEDEDKV